MFDSGLAAKTGTFDTPLPSIPSTVPFTQYPDWQTFVPMATSRACAQSTRNAMGKHRDLFLSSGRGATPNQTRSSAIPEILNSPFDDVLPVNRTLFRSEVE